MRQLRIVVLLLISLGLISCGGGRKLPSTPPLDSVSPVNAAEKTAPVKEITLQKALAELEAFQVPEGVDDALFQELKEELAKQLQAKGVSKLVSKPPTGEANRVDDLTLIDNGDSTYLLTWSYKNVGDYNQDGIVDVKDITPLAIHFQKTTSPTNEWIDGNADTVINIMDITPLAVNFFNDVASYVVSGAGKYEGPFTDFVALDLGATVGDERLLFELDVTERTDKYYHVFPQDGSGANGVISRIAPPLTIEVASQHINDVLMEADDPFSPEALEAAKQAALSQSVVEQAVVVAEEESLVVKYKDGGFQVWQGDIPKPVPPADLAQFEERMGSMLAEIRSVSAPVGTRQAVLIDSLYDDPAFDVAEDVLNLIEWTLENKGMSVERLNGSQEATIANLKQLSDCSVLVMMGHGGKGIGFVEFLPYSVQIGEPWSWAYYADWLRGRIAWILVPWGEGDKKTREKNLKSFVAVTGRFWSYYYENSHFNNGLFLNLACSSSRYEFFRNELFRVGIKGYTGWSEDTTISPFTAWRMLAKMADEKTLQQAYDELPYDYKHQNLSDDRRSWETDLWVGEDDGLELTLGGPILPGLQITITSPENGTTITARTCMVEGDILPWQIGGGVYYATIAVNEQSNALVVDNMGNFSHEVGLRAGENTIRVSVITTAERSKEVQVTGAFEPDIFWSQLSWNTDWNDIDLHLVPVEGADGKRDECYYINMVSSWGAELDVDDVNGYGPEHITARSLPAGKYLLYVHYYDTHGQTMPAVVTVKVSVNDGQTQVYTLPAMESAAHAWWDGEGDFWEVCYVSYPAGTIETIDKYLPGGRRAAGLPFLPKGKIDLSK